MAPLADHAKLASQARRLYIEQLLKGLPAVVTAVTAGVRSLLDKPAEYATAQRRRDLVQNLMKQSGNWHGAMASGLRHVLQHGVTAAMPGDTPARNDVFSLVDNDTIEREILTSRLALAVMDRVSWEFTDLRSRIAMLERRGELDTHDMLRAHVLARVVLDAWRGAGLSSNDWREAQPVLHEEFASLAEGPAAFGVNFVHTPARPPAGVKPYPWLPFRSSVNERSMKGRYPVFHRRQCRDFSDSVRCPVFRRLPPSRNRGYVPGQPEGCTTNGAAFRKIRGRTPSRKPRGGPSARAGSTGAGASVPAASGTKPGVPVPVLRGPEWRPTARDQN